MIIYNKAALVGGFVCFIIKAQKFYSDFNEYKLGHLLKY